MEIRTLEAATMRSLAVEAADTVRNGGIVVYPTDTLYGLGADALSNASVSKVYDIKGRDERKPIHGLVPDIEMAGQFGDIDPLTRTLARVLPKGKVTFIVRKRPGIDTGILENVDTFGFRIPDSDFCAEFVRSLGNPVTATSANLSGLPPLRSAGAIIEQFGPAAEALSLVIDAGELPPSEPSTVIDMTADRPVILRDGAVPAAEVWEAAGMAA